MESLDPFSSAPLQLGIGALSGLAVGVALRKLATLVLLVVGLGLLFVFGLSQLGVATVNWQALDGQLQQWAQALTVWGKQTWQQVSTIGAGFVGGLLLGWRWR